MKLEREGEIQHAVLGVHIVKNRVQVECDCGWRSKIATNETSARKEHDGHAEKG